MTNQDDVVTAALHLSRAIMRENGKILRPTCSLKRFRQALVHFCRAYSSWGGETHVLPTTDSLLTSVARSGEYDTSTVL